VVILVYLEVIEQAVQSNMVAERGCIKRMLINKDGIKRLENSLKVTKGPSGEFSQIDSNGLDTDGRRDRQRALRDRVEPRKEDSPADSRRGRRGNRSSRHNSRNSR